MPKKPALPKKLASKKLAPKKLAAGKLAPSKKKIVKAAQSIVANDTGALVLDRLYQVVMSRRTADPALSHSARLLARGPEKVAQKFGEEAVECVIEGVTGNKPALIGESADLLYHLVVLWASRDIAPSEVWDELRRREGISGVAEKAARPVARALGIATRKIP